MLLPIALFALLTVPDAVFAQAASPSAAPADGFHAPSSVPEQTLNRILVRVDKDGHALANLTGGEGRKGFRPSVDYTTMLTPKLLDDIARVEREAVRGNCGGHYKNGEACGLDYIPVTCAQDEETGYLYRTEEQTADTARIAYRWPDSGEVVALYRLVQAGGIWRIDGIDCTGSDSFNWGER